MSLKNWVRGATWADKLEQLQQRVQSLSIGRTVIRLVGPVLFVGDRYWKGLVWDRPLCRGVHDCCLISCKISTVLNYYPLLFYKYYVCLKRNVNFFDELYIVEMVEKDTVSIEWKNVQITDKGLLKSKMFELLKTLKTVWVHATSYAVYFKPEKFITIIALYFI